MKKLNTVESEAIFDMLYDETLKSVDVIKVSKEVLKTISEDFGKEITISYLNAYIFKNGKCFLMFASRGYVLENNEYEA